MKIRPIKTTFLFALALLAGGLMAPKADARLYVGFSSIHHIGYSSGGHSLYQKRVVVGFDRYHRPIYRYYAVPQKSRIRGHAARRSYHYPSYAIRSQRPHSVHYRGNTRRSHNVSRARYGNSYRNRYHGPRRVTIR